MRACSRRSAPAARRAGAGALLLVGLALGGSLLVALVLGQPAASAGVNGSPWEEPAASQAQGPASEKATSDDAEHAAADLDAEIEASGQDPMGAVQAGPPDERGASPDARPVVPQLATMIPPQAPPGQGEEGDQPPGDDPEAGDGVSGVEGVAAGAVQAPVPAGPVRLTAANLGTVEDLRSLLEQRVPPEQLETWGTGWAKTVEALHYEIGVGEGVVAVAPGSDGAETLIREMHAVAAEVRHAAADGQVWRNYEWRQQPDGSFEPRIRYGPIDVGASTLFGKMKAGASPEETMLRELEEEAGVLPANVTLTPLGTSAGWTDSPSFPGLPTYSTYYLFAADVDKDGFAGGATRLEHHPDGTPPSLFTWQTQRPVEGDRRSAADAPAPAAAFQLLPGTLPPAGAGFGLHPPSVAEALLPGAAWGLRLPAADPGFTLDEPDPHQGLLTGGPLVQLPVVQPGPDLLEDRDPAGWLMETADGLGDVLRPWVEGLGLAAGTAAGYGLARGLARPRSTCSLDGDCWLFGNAY